MIRAPFWLLPAVGLFLTTSASAQTLSFGNVDVQQNDKDNTTASVTVTLEYAYGSIAVRAGSNRGDYNLQFSPTATSDRAGGILITTVRENGRDNSHAGDAPALRYATSAIASSGGWFVPVHNTSGSEWNTDFAAAWFPYAEGWIGGHATTVTVTTANPNPPLSGFLGSSGLTLTSTAPTADDTNYIYDDPATNGLYELKLSGINSMTDGILLTVGGDNLDNYTMARANADGTWTVQVADNGTDGASANYRENTGFGFVYVPKTKVVTSQDQAGIHAMGRVNGNMTRDVTAGDYVVVRSGLGTYKLYAPGLDPATASLLLGMEMGTGDNILTYGAIAHGWEIANRDLSSAGLQDAGSGDLLSFTLMAGSNTAAIWDAGGGADAKWSTTSNWAGDSGPTAGKDVILGGSGSSVQIDTAQEAGMVYIKRDTTFNITGTAPLTIKTGLVLNSAPTSAQTYTVSAPIILGDHAFIISQSMGSGVTLRFDVASGNAITSDGFDLTLGGAGTIDIRDSVSLGSGTLIKEGDGQVELNAALDVGRIVITGGSTGTTSGAFRLSTAAAYGFFGNNTLELQSSRPDGAVDRGATATTALFFDAGAGSGELSNDILFHSTLANSNIRFLADAGATMNVTLSGLMSGGNATSRVIFSSDAATGQGKFHLTNTASTFLAEHIQIDRGALVIYGDGSLGAAENDLYLNTNNSTSTTGLHFGADNIVLNASRRVFIAADTVVHTEGYNATIAGVISSPVNNNGVPYTGGLIKEGEGILTLSGINTFTGKIRVNAGMIAISSEDNLGAAPAAATPDQLILNAGGLQALADLDIDDTNRGILLEAGGGIDTNGHHVRVGAVISGLGSFFKLGEGTLEFTGANTYTGSTTVQQGTLIVNNPGTPAMGAVTVYNGGTFGGKGTVGGSAVVEGIIAPGTAPGETGTLVFSQGLELYPRARVEFEIASQTEFDKIEVAGAPLGVDASTVFEVSLVNGPGWGWEFDLLDWVSLSADSDLSDNFVLPDLSAWGWHWNTDNLAEGRLQIVPEPSRALLLLGGVLVCLLRRRR